MQPPFTMSKFVSTKDLYQAKATYYENIAKLLAANARNGKLSDADFRQLVRDSIPEFGADDAPEPNTSPVEFKIDMQKYPEPRPALKLKAFWDNLFFDMEECGLDKAGFAQKAGKEIRDDLSSIEDAIKDYDGKKALALIDELKTAY